MFEKRTEPLLPRAHYVRRQVRHGGIAGLVVLVSLAVGVIGYRLTEGMAWIDALENAAMILGGMGPTAVLQTNAGKLFASAYALFSGVIFLVAVAILLAPALHRLLHHFHLDSEK